jgi:hypothetical protein
VTTPATPEPERGVVLRRIKGTCASSMLTIVGIIQGVAFAALLGIGAG